MRIFFISENISKNIKEDVISKFHNFPKPIITLFLYIIELIRINQEDDYNKMFSDHL